MNSSASQIVRISGIIKSISYQEIYWNGVKYISFTVVTLKSQNNYRCYLRKGFFLPIHEYDQFSAYGSMHDKIIIINEKPRPYVMISTHSSDICNCFIRALRGKGVGPFKAKNLYAHLQKVMAASDQDTGDANANVPSILTSLSERYVDKSDGTALDILTSGGLNNTQAKTLLYWWYRNIELRRLYLLGLNNKEINACQLPSSQIYDRCVTNPYTLAGYSIEKAEAIALMLKLELHENARACGMTIRAIHKSMECGGHNGIRISYLQRLVPRLRYIKDELLKNYSVYFDQNTAYLEYAYEAEKFIAEFLIKIMSEHEEISDENDILTTKDIVLTEDQITAVSGALQNPVTIITGPPGSGKTAVIRQIVHNNQILGRRTWIASLTGRAVSVIKKVINSPEVSVTTIHRLIGSVKSQYRENNANSEYKPFEHLIIDEFSMVDTALLYDMLYILRAYSFKITFVGDKDQLPPIKWGDAFTSLIACRCIPIYILGTIHRVYEVEGQKDGITLNAQKIIRARKHETLSLEETANFRLIEGDICRAQDIISQFHQQGISPEDFIICCPYNIDLLVLNQYCQEVYQNGNTGVTDFAGNLWRLSDKILQYRNDYDADVYNGQVGYITDVNKLGIEVRFSPSHLVTYPFRKEEIDRESRMSNLSLGKFIMSRIHDTENPEAEIQSRTIADVKLGYAGSVHSWQGGEANFVIFYVPRHKTGGSFLNQKLIYTAITRAKRACYIICEDLEYFAECCKQPAPFRIDNLGARLSAKLPVHPFNENQHVEKTLSNNIEDDFDPYSFQSDESLLDDIADLWN